MGKMISAKINLDKIKDNLLYVGEKGTYLNLTIWINEDKPDKYGNTISIQQTTKKDEPKNYLGEGKFVEKKEEEQTIESKGEWRGKVGVKSMSDPKDLPGVENIISEETSDLPF